MARREWISLPSELARDSGSRFDPMSLREDWTRRNVAREVAIAIAPREAKTRKHHSVFQRGNSGGFGGLAKLARTHCSTAEHAESAEKGKDGLARTLRAENEPPRAPRRNGAIPRFFVIFVSLVVESSFAPAALPCPLWRQLGTWS